MKKAYENVPPSITEEIDSIPGRRLMYNLSDTQSFDATNAGTRGAAMNFLVSQDGPFIMTHYPVVLWKPTTPSDATQFGYWRPPFIFPVPAQEAGTDFINISWELVSGGSQRNFQNESAVPMFSQPNNMIPLPVPTMFDPNDTIQFFPTYESISFDSTVTTPTTAGLLQVTLPGYRIANM